MSKQDRIAKQRERRGYRVRAAQRGSARLRASVCRTNKSFSVQIIDDVKGVTIVSASSADLDAAPAGKQCGNCQAAAAVGKLIAERAIAAGVSEVRLDRGRYRYHGRVRAFADAARDGGLVF